MRYELKRIEIWSVVKIVFVISLFIGFLISLLYAGLFLLMGTLGTALGGQDFASLLPVGGIALVFIIFFVTIVISVVYTLAAIIFIGLYNLIAGWAGGFVVQFESIPEPRQISSMPKTEEPAS